MVEYALAQVLLESGVEPDYVLGTSMGEFCSAAIAGVMEARNYWYCFLSKRNYLKIIVMKAVCLQ